MIRIFRFTLGSVQRRILPVLLLAASSWSFAADQTVTLSPAPDETIQLSPFQVKTDRDTGFVAATSLAGGRLAGDLKDTPAAYSVLTRDFIDALQLTDLNAMSQWLPGASMTADNGTRVIFGNEQQMVTYRGRKTNSIQRNFFPFDYNFDNYNVERLDLARGANAILFGNGTYGGNPNAVTKRALLGRPSADMRYTYGSWNYNRSTVDVNASGSQNFAVRFNGLWQQRNGWQDNDDEVKRAATLAATWQVTKKTEMRAEAEYGERTANAVFAGIDDRFSGWDGKSVYASRLTSLPSDANARGISRYSTNYPVFTPDNGGTLINYGQTAMTLGGNNSAAVPVDGVLVAGPTANIANNPMLFSQGLPDDRFATAIANSHFQLPKRSFTTTPTAPLRFDRFRDFTTGITQAVTDRLFVDVSWNYLSTLFKGNYIYRTIDHAYIDINQNLPTGAPNPNFLEPYSEGQSQMAVTRVRASNLLVNASYDFGETKLGAFRVNVLAAQSRQHSDFRFFSYALAANPDSRYWPTEQPIIARYYWNETSRPLPTPSSWTYVNPATKTTQTVPAGFYLNNTSNTVSRAQQNFDYVLASLTGKFWHDRIDVVTAVRRDHFTATSDLTVALKDNPLGWNGVTEYFKPAAPSDFYTLTYIPKSSTGVPTGPAAPATARPRDANGFALPQYANDRFQDDYSPPKVDGWSTTKSAGTVVHVTKALSAFVNYGETYDLPPISSVSISNALFSGTRSSGWDYGFRLSLLNGRIVATALRYTGSSDTLGQTTSSASSTRLDQDIDNIITARVEGDNSAGGSNGLGFPQVPSKYYDSTHTEFNGYEFETVANLSRSWRLSANVSLPRAYSSDIFPQTRAYLAANDATLRQIMSQAGVLIDAKNVATVDQSVPINKQSPDAAKAATAWNSIQDILGSITAGRQPAQQITLVTANIFTDYTFNSGKLRGLRVGGGWNYRGSQIIGFRGGETIRDPNNPSQAIPNPAVSTLTPVYRDPYFTGMAVIGYTYRLAQHRSLTLTLKVDNLFNYRQPIYYSTALRPVNGDLTNPARVAVPDNYGFLPPRAYYLSAAVNF